MAGCSGGWEVDEGNCGIVPRLLVVSFCMKEGKSGHHLTNSFQEIASICQKLIELLLAVCINNNAHNIRLHIKCC